MTDSKTTVFCPVYDQIIQRRGNGWAFKHGEPFINLFNVPNLSPEEEFIAFGTSMKKVAIELFWINGGKQGYYIANILDKKYYYSMRYKEIKLKIFMV